MNDSDLEDIESHLYSQVFHSYEEISEESSRPHPENPKVSTTVMKKPNRYFHSGVKSPFTKFSNKVSHNEQSNKNLTLKQSQGLYSKDYVAQNKRNRLINPLVVLGTVAERPIVCRASKRQIRAAQWKAKCKERKRQKDGEIKADQQGEKVPECEIIVLSDTDEESCVEIPNKWPVFSVVDSDDDGKDDKSAQNDVVFVEPINEIINIDESEANAQKHSTALMSPSKFNSPSKLRKERKELLSTPDSGSNDFINNLSMELTNKNFNFSLHGADFGNGDFNKPTKQAETCETESTASTTDLNAMKTAVFNEIEFPKGDIFSDVNLENFGNLITPLRKSVSKINTQSPAADMVDNSQSDGSSDNDFEEVTLKKDLSRQSKHLPDLSPMHSECESKTQKSRSAVLCSKYDFIDGAQPAKKKKTKGGLANEKKHVKKNKNKKKIIAAAIVSDEVVDESTRKGDEFELNKQKVKKRKCNNFEKAVEYYKGVLVKKIKSKKSEDDNVVNRGINIEAETQGNENFELHNPNQSETVTEPSAIKNNEKNITQLADTKTEQLKDDSVTSTIKCKNSEVTILKTNDVTVQIDPEVDDKLLRVESYGINISSASTIPLSPRDIQIVNCANQQLQNIDEPSTSVCRSKLQVDLKTCSLEEVQQAMSNDPKLWHILDSDRVFYKTDRQGRRCNKCREKGHMAIRCPNKVVAKCTLCGKSGHYEPRCPNRICTQCGERSPYSTTSCRSCFKFMNRKCQVCSVTGHGAFMCPDLWRRYHLTTSDGPLIAHSGPILKPKSKLWCSGCAQSGHLEYCCQYYTSLYPPADPHIQSYENIYEKEERCQVNEEPNAALNYGETSYQSQQYAGNYFVPQEQYIFNFNQKPNLLGNDQFQRLYPYLMNRQENVYNGTPDNFQYPLNQIQLVPNLHSYIPLNDQRYNNEYYLDNNLTNLISFESPIEPSVMPNSAPPTERYFNANRNGPARKPTAENENIGNLSIWEKYTKINKVFFRTPAQNIQQFVNEDLARLSKLSYQISRNIKDLKKKQIPRSFHDRNAYYQTLNMMLFGIFNLIDGQKHLARLKSFKKQRASKLSHQRRQELLRSYCYIFGLKKHNGVDYEELLRRI